MRKPVALRVECETHDDRIFAAVLGLVVTAPDTDLLESDALIETDGADVARPYLEEKIGGSARSRELDEMREHFAAHATTPILRADAKIEDVRLAGSDAQNAIAHEDPVDLGHATDIPCSQTVVKDPLAPRIRITQALGLGDSRYIVLRHAPEPELGNG
jgi:hypothetical protein